ncbi:MAG: hypothetical protein ACE10F_08870, partial [Candidatus Methylomirabilales bacterium]
RRLAQGPCCQPTRECLISWIEVFPTQGNGVQITIPKQAKAWLQESDEASLEPEIALTDSLGRIALVTRQGVKNPERWEHLYGCWRRIQTPQ